MRGYLTLSILLLFSGYSVFAQKDYYHRKAESYTRKSEYYQKNADGYPREAEYYLKKAEGYQREAAYYTKRGKVDSAKTYARYAAQADEKAAQYLKWAANALSKL